MNFDGKRQELKRTCQAGYTAAVFETDPRANGVSFRDLRKSTTGVEPEQSRGCNPAADRRHVLDRLWVRHDSNPV